MTWPPAERDPLDARAGADLAAEAAQVGDERVGQRARAAARAGPADRVAEQVQVEGGDRAAGPRRRRVAVHRGAVEPRARAGAVEQPPAERRRPTRAAAARSPARAAGRCAASSCQRARRRGGKPESIVARTASKASRNGRANCAQRSPSPARSASRLAAVALEVAVEHGRARRPAAGAPSTRPGAPTPGRARRSGIRANTGEAAAAG